MSLSFTDLRNLFEGVRRDHPGRTSIQLEQPKIPYGRGYQTNAQGMPQKIRYGTFTQCNGTIRHPRDGRGRKIRNQFLARNS